MGNLTRVFDGGAINLNKATISVWFRIPTATATAVQARDGLSVDEDVRVLPWTIPILMWGTQQTVSVSDWVSDTVSCPDPPNPDKTADVFYPDSSHSCPIQQSCIGVQCYPGSDPTLVVHIQPDQGTSNSEGSLTSTGPGYECDLITHFPFPETEDVSDLLDGVQGGAVGNLGNTSTNVIGSGPSGGTPIVSLDTWHHLIISWDLGAESSVSRTVTQQAANQPAEDRITTASKLYCSLDDVNKNGFDLPATWIGSDGFGSPDPNDIVCGQVWERSQTTYNPATPGQVETTTTMSYGTIPTSPFWCPGTSAETQSRGTITGNQKIDTAELHVYDDILWDTSVEANRRRFVKANGTPETDYAAADAALGASPKIRFSGSDSWKIGLNTGTAGNFTKVGTILPLGTPTPDLTP